MGCGMHENEPDALAFHNRNYNGLWSCKGTDSKTISMKTVEARRSQVKRGRHLGWQGKPIIAAFYNIGKDLLGKSEHIMQTWLNMGVASLHA